MGVGTHPKVSGGVWTVQHSLVHTRGTQHDPTTPVMMRTHTSHAGWEYYYRYCVNIRVQMVLILPARAVYIHTNLYYRMWMLQD